MIAAVFTTSTTSPDPTMWSTSAGDRRSPGTKSSAESSSPRSRSRGKRLGDVAGDDVAPGVDQGAHEVGADEARRTGDDDRSVVQR